MSNSEDSDRLQATLDLSEPGELYRILFEEAADGLFITDRGWHFLAVNPRGIEMSGYSLDELLGKTISDLITAEDLVTDPIRMDDLREGKTVTKERRMRRNGGGLLPVEITARMLPEGNLLGIVRDISERKKTQAALDQRARELMMLHELGLAVSTSLSSEQVTTTALQHIQEAIHPDLVFLSLIEDERWVLTKTPAPEDRPLTGIIPYEWLSGCVGRLVAREGKPVYVRNIHDDSRCMMEESIATGITSLALLPLWGTEGIIGIIGLASESDQDFESRAGFLDTMAHLVSIALKNAWLYEVSLRETADRERTKEALRESEGRFQLAMEASRDGLWDWNVTTDEVYFSPAYSALLGYAPGELPAHVNSWADLIHPEDKEAALGANMDCIENRQDVFNVKFRMKARNGEWRWILGRGKAVARDSGGKAVRMIGTHTDITDLVRAEEALRRSEERLRSLIDSAPFGAHVYELDDHDRLIFRGYNKSANRILGTDNAPFIGKAIEEAFPPLAATEIPAKYKHVAATGEGYETEHMDYDHEQIRGAYQVHAFQVSPRWMAAFFIDITERKKAEIEKERLREQLFQAKKMESVGRLAGGVAHDFNNLLSVILGHAELALMGMTPGQPVFDNLKEIRTATERSAELTGQLLAFARKQTIAPRILDLNTTMEGMLKMLRRLIGEHIDLAWLPEGEPWPVMMDPSQVDQVLVNLSVNARDAISGAGKLTIETGNMTFDKDYCAAHVGFSPGEYVMLAISDNGHGMDKETVDRLFEPFFTTKELGKGTGLGLATVYGIVKQNNGFINVYSEPGQGTTFKIYLPRYTGEVSGAERERGPGPLMLGRETILLVEDEPAILNLSKKMLETLGYRVIATSAPGEAIRLTREYAGDIHLLMTDVIMPEMNGRELSQILLSLRPRLKCLFTSGYTANVIAHHGALDEGINFIQKPFSIHDLSAKVRAALNALRRPGTDR